MTKWTRYLRLAVVDYSGGMSLPRKVLTLASTTLIGLSFGYFIMESDLDLFSDPGLPTAAVAAFMLGLMVLNAVVASEIEEKKEYEAEMEIAKRIQTGLLPGELPRIPGCSLAALHTPARAVGGDYYDAIPTSGGSLALVIADVSGKGVPAAILMANVRALVRTLVAEDPSPASVLDRVNRRIVEDTEPDRFVTLFYALVDPASGRVRYAGAGHDPPYRIRASGHLDTLDAGGPILGFLGDAAFEEGEFALEPGDALLLYTDGVTDTVDPKDRFFGAVRLTHTAAAASGRGAETILRKVAEKIGAFQAGAEPTDDSTLLVLSRSS